MTSLLMTEISRGMWLFGKTSPFILPHQHSSHFVCTLHQTELSCTSDIAVESNVTSVSYLFSSHSRFSMVHLPLCISHPHPISFRLRLPGCSLNHLSQHPNPFRYLVFVIEIIHLHFTREVRVILQLGNSKNNQT